MHGYDPDEELWRRTQKKDEAAFELLRIKYRPFVRGEIRKRLHHVDEAEIQDIDQMIWLAVWSSVERFRGSSLFSTWVAGISKNTIFCWLRKQTNEANAFSNAAADSSSQRSQFGEEREIVNHLMLTNALYSLEASERAVIYFRYFEQLTDEEVTHRLRMPLGTVKLRLRTGLKKMRTSMLAGESGDSAAL